MNYGARMAAYSCCLLMHAHVHDREGVDRREAVAVIKGGTAVAIRGNYDCAEYGALSASAMFARVIQVRR